MFTKDVSHDAGTKDLGIEFEPFNEILTVSKSIQGQSKI